MMQIMLFINNMYTCKEYAKHINKGSTYPIVLGRLRCKRRKKERERTNDKGQRTKDKGKRKKEKGRNIYLGTFKRSGEAGLG